MKIHALLNPCGGHHGYRSSESPTPTSTPRSVVPYTTAPKRQKIPKDAPVFSEGNRTVGFVNYPPYEATGDMALTAQHRRFQVFPMGEIRKKGVRHIPYNSDKKDFMEKTGRDAFEMYQYTYRVPGEEKEYVVVWDYNVGLVRMTPFFKSLKYSKTIPAKAIRENPGLKEISYSITGGALVCQGYWMPYQAAKAIAATFCYEIRWALTPVFGNDFPSSCIHPKDPNFAKFIIDQDIVRQCVDETERFRREGVSYKIDAAKPCPPKLQFGSPPWGVKSTKLWGPRTSEEESGYASDTRTDRSEGEKYFCSPPVSPRSQTWTSVNRSQTPTSPPTPCGPPIFSHSHGMLAPLQPLLPTSVPGGFYEESLRTKRTHSKVGTGCGKEEGYIRLTTAAATPDLESDHESDNCGDGVHTRKELDAAEIMLQLSAADRVTPPMKRTRRGSRF